MPFDLQMPDGSVLRDIPDGTTKEQIEAKLRASGNAGALQRNTWGQALKNVSEASLSLATGVAGSIAGNAAGLAALGVDSIGSLFGRDPGSTADPAKVRDAVAGAIQYEPSYPDSLSSKITQAPGKAVAGLGNILADAPGIRGTPYVDTFVRESLVPAAAEGLGVKMARTARAKAARPDVPSTEALHDAARDAYKRVEGSGAIIEPDVYNAALDTIHKNAAALGLDKSLTPKSLRVLERLEESRGKPLDFMEAEKLRRVANGVADEVHPGTGRPTADANIARKIVEDLDDALDALPEASEARKAWSRYRRSEMLDEISRKAEIQAGANFTQSGLEHALRSQFKTLAMNPKKMRAFSPEARAAIELVAKGSRSQNAMRLLGKFAPTGVVSAGVGAGVGALAGGGVGAVALPVVGTGARALATRKTLQNVDAAREALVGRGLPGQAPPTVGAGVGAKPFAAGQVLAAPAPDQYSFMRGRAAPVGAGPARGLDRALGRGEQSAPQGETAAELFAQLGVKPGTDSRAAVETIRKMFSDTGGADAESLVQALRRGGKKSKERLLSGPELDAVLERYMSGGRP